MPTTKYHKTLHISQLFESVYHRISRRTTGQFSRSVWRLSARRSLLISDMFLNNSHPSRRLNCQCNISSRGEGRGRFAGRDLAIRWRIWSVSIAMVGVNLSHILIDQRWCYGREWVRNRGEINRSKPTLHLRLIKLSVLLQHQEFPLIYAHSNVSRVSGKGSWFTMTVSRST